MIVDADSTTKPTDRETRFSLPRQTGAESLTRRESVRRRRRRRRIGAAILINQTADESSTREPSEDETRVRDGERSQRGKGWLDRDH